MPLDAPPEIHCASASVASGIPCLRARSTVFGPASCSKQNHKDLLFRDLTRFIVRSFI